MTIIILANQMEKTPENCMETVVIGMVTKCR